MFAAREIFLGLRPGAYGCNLQRLATSKKSDPRLDKAGGRTL